MSGHHFYEQIDRQAIDGRRQTDGHYCHDSCCCDYCSSMSRCLDSYSNHGNYFRRLDCHHQPQHDLKTNLHASLFLELNRKK